MKNTKHTENLDNSTPQEITSQSKRKILTSIGVSSGIIGASALSQQWTKPIVNSIILPAHAQSTPMMTTMAMGDMTTTPSMSDGMDDGTTTTMMPTTAMPEPTTTMAPAAAVAGIVLSRTDFGVVRGGSVNSVRVKLATEPTGPVTVTVVSTPASASIAPDTNSTPLSFTALTWDDDQLVDITASGQPTSMSAESATTVVFDASDTGGYTNVEASLTYTVGYYGLTQARMVKAVPGSAPRSADITWMAPTGTRASATAYRVDSDLDGVTSQTVKGTRAEFTELPLTDDAATVHTFTVTAIYDDADADVGTAPSDPVTIV